MKYLTTLIGWSCLAYRDSLWNKLVCGLDLRRRWSEHVKMETPHWSWKLIHAFVGWAAVGHEDGIATQKAILYFRLVRKEETEVQQKKTGKPDATSPALHLYSHSNDVLKLGTKDANTPASSTKWAYVTCIQTLSPRRSHLCRPRLQERISSKNGHLRALSAESYPCKRRHYPLFLLRQHARTYFYQTRRDQRRSVSPSQSLVGSHKPPWINELGIQCHLRS